MSFSGLALTGTFVQNLTKNVFFSVFKIDLSLWKNQAEKKRKAKKIFLS